MLIKKPYLGLVLVTANKKQIRKKKNKESQLFTCKALVKFLKGFNKYQNFEDAHLSKELN